MPGCGEKNVEWIEDKGCSLQGHFRSLKTAKKKWGNNGDKLGLGF